MSRAIILVEVYKKIWQNTFRGGEKMQKFSIFLTLLITTIVFAACGRETDNERLTDYETSPDVEFYEPAPAVVTEISTIPFIGNRENFRLPAEHAQAYAHAISSAGLEVDGLHFSFDTLYPILIDVSGDGVPLLLLIGQADETGQWGDLPLHPNLLFGFADNLQLITQFMAVGITEFDGENLLTIGGVSDFGGSYHFYRVDGGAAEFVSTMIFVADWHGGTPPGEISIDGVELSPEDYFAALEAIPTVSLIEKWHPGNVVATSLLQAHMPQPFTREQAAQIFTDHAAFVRNY